MNISYFINDPSGMPMPYTFIITGVCTNISGNNLEVEAENTSNPIIFVKYDFLSESLAGKNASIRKLLSKSVLYFKAVKAITEKYNIEFYYADEAYEIISGITGIYIIYRKIDCFLIMLIFIVAAFNINVMGFIDRKRENPNNARAGKQAPVDSSVLFRDDDFFHSRFFRVCFALCSLRFNFARRSVFRGSWDIVLGQEFFLWDSSKRAFDSVYCRMRLDDPVGSLSGLFNIQMNPVEVFREGNL